MNGACVLPGSRGAEVLRGSGGPVCHADAAGCALVSHRALAAQHEHLDRERTLGGVFAEFAVEDTIQDLRADLADLVSCGPADVALTDNAPNAFATLTAAWVLPP